MLKKNPAVKDEFSLKNMAWLGWNSCIVQIQEMVLLHNVLRHSIPVSSNEHELLCYIMCFVCFQFWEEDFRLCPPSKWVPYLGAFRDASCLYHCLFVQFTFLCSSKAFVSKASNFLKKNWNKWPSCFWVCSRSILSDLNELSKLYFLEYFFKYLLWSLTVQTFKRKVTFLTILNYF